jgi:prepilin peptidase CpaA
MIHALQILLLLTFPLLVLAAGLRDVTSYIIPNWISLVLAAAFPVAALALGLPLPLIAVNLAVGAVGLGLGVAMFALGWIGGGDAKLFAAAALWLGLPAAPTYLAVIGLAGGALAMGLLLLRSVYVRPYMPRNPAWFARLAQPGENVPYGVAIAVGALAAFPLSALVAHV